MAAWDYGLRHQQMNDLLEVGTVAGITWLAGAFIACMQYSANSAIGFVRSGGFSVRGVIHPYERHLALGAPFATPKVRTQPLLLSRMSLLGLSVAPEWPPRLTAAPTQLARQVAPRLLPVSTESLSYAISGASMAGELVSATPHDAKDSQCGLEAIASTGEPSENVEGGRLSESMLLSAPRPSSRMEVALYHPVGKEDETTFVVQGWNIETAEQVHGVRGGCMAGYYPWGTALLHCRVVRWVRWKAAQTGLWSRTPVLTPSAAPEWQPRVTATPNPLARQAVPRLLSVSPEILHRVPLRARMTGERVAAKLQVDDDSQCGLEAIDSTGEPSLNVEGVQMSGGELYSTTRPSISKEIVLYHPVINEDATTFAVQGLKTSIAEVIHVSEGCMAGYNPWGSAMVHYRVARCMRWKHRVPMLRHTLPGNRATWMFKLGPHRDLQDSELFKVKIMAIPSLLPEFAAVSTDGSRHAFSKSLAATDTWSMHALSTMYDRWGRLQHREPFPGGRAPLASEILPHQGTQDDDFLQGEGMAGPLSLPDLAPQTADESHYSLSKYQEDTDALSIADSSTRYERWKHLQHDQEGLRDVLDILALRLGDYNPVDRNTELDAVRDLYVYLANMLLPQTFISRRETTIPLHTPQGIFERARTAMSATTQAVLLAGFFFVIVAVCALSVKNRRQVVRPPPQQPSGRGVSDREQEATANIAKREDQDGEDTDKSRAVTHKPCTSGGGRSLPTGLKGGTPNVLGYTK